MGLLSDPSLTPRNKLGRTLSKHSGKISLLFYVAGLVWYICLAHPNFNHGTYLSENALSPGLVYPEIKQDSSRLAQTFLEELLRERNDLKSAFPVAWIVAKMKQIGLETYVHNFTLHYPFSSEKEYHGKNVYGILRAPRIGSTEGVIFSAPYRAPTSLHEDIPASVPTLLAFAEFARKKNYWAKDLIFLVTDQEQLGMQAWLEAYYGNRISSSAVLNCGNLPARAGALQAALNLEIQDFDIDYIDVKIEGLNGQLPNLDMFNLVQRITSREGIISGYKQRSLKKRRSSYHDVDQNLKHMTTMLFSQSTGMPTGNHGLFHRYRIESLTLEAVKRPSNSPNANRHTLALPLLKTIEGISRSLNNLLERFHQSYFFYILVQNDRFVSIGDYIPCLALLSGPMFIKAFLQWLTVFDVDIDEKHKSVEEKKNVRNADQEDILIKTILTIFGIAVGLGLLCLAIPMNESIRQLISNFGKGTSSTVVNILMGFMAISLCLPFSVKLTAKAVKILAIIILISFGVALIAVGLLNFALGFFLAVICCPFAILMTDNQQHGFKNSLSRLYIVLLNPFVIIYVIVLLLNAQQFPELDFKILLGKSLTGVKDSITFALMDNIIYGNILYTIISAVFFPIWTLSWTLTFTKIEQ